ncbi:hypothetical protein DFQ28_006629 [Apophysomyces sp. BC1034]|nr:hypothetical protein DFQ28_006629 [Apophysomyces sp. BC1034]
MYSLRLTSGMWTLMADYRPALHGVLLTVLALLGVVSWAGLFLYPLTFQWAVLLVILGHTFHQPVRVLADSAILKILDNYRVLLQVLRMKTEPQHRWGKLILVVLFAGLGWGMTYSRIEIILLSMVATGAFLLLLLTILNHAIQTPEIDDEEFTPLFLKNGLQPLDSGSTHVPYGLYQPYSLFAEQLSHISEEDTSMLQQMASNTSLMRHPSWTASVDSSGHSSWTAAPVPPHLPVSSFELALLPLPPPESPIVAIASYLPWIHVPDEYQQPRHTIHDKRTTSLLITMFLMGLVGAMLNTLLYLFLHYSLAMPVFQIGLVAAATMLMDLLAHTTARRWIKSFDVMTLNCIIHGTLVFTSLAYTCLRPGLLCWVLAIGLQALQGANQANAILWMDRPRMMQCGKMSAMFSSLGPAVGSLLAGYLVENQSMPTEGFTFLYRSVVAALTFSFVVSWGWSAVDD